MKHVRRIIVSILVIIILILCFIGGVAIYGRIHYKPFFDKATNEFEIPEIDKGYVPQGITYTTNEEKEYFVMSGFVSDGSCSKLYIVDYETKKSTSVKMKNVDGSDYISHSGGITCDDTYFYVCDYDDDNYKNTGRQSLILKSDVFDGDDTVTVVKRIDVCVSAAFNYYYDGLLYVGEFYRDKSYDTRESHHYTTKANDNNKAIIVAYDLSDDNLGKVVKAYSITDLVQGMCFTKSGKIVFSTSWSISDSHLYVYDVPSTNESTINIDGNDIPLYALDSSNLNTTYNLAPMSEEVVYVDGKVYTIYESASNKYIFGKLFRGRYCYSIEIA